MSTIGRRLFLSKGAAAVSAITVARFAGTRSDAFAEPEAVDPTSAQAVSLGYVHDATKTDVAKFTKRASPEGAKQFCNNCMFYSNGGQKLAGKEGEWGGCILFAGKVVNGAGWCNSWAPKAG